MKHSTGWMALGIGLAATVACSSFNDPFEAAMARIEQSHQEIGACESSHRDLEMMKCVNDVFAEVGVWWQQNAPDFAALTDVQVQKLQSEMQGLDARVRKLAARFVVGNNASAAATPPESATSDAEPEASADGSADDSAATDASAEAAPIEESAVPAAIDEGAEN